MMVYYKCSPHVKIWNIRMCTIMHFLFIAHHKDDKKCQVIEDSESQEMDEQGFDQSTDTPNVDMSQGQYS